jgi:polysaccharide deacetylase family sporulation protein PdaB
MKRKNLKTIVLSTIVFCGLFATSFEVTHLLLPKKQITLNNALSSLPDDNTITSEPDKNVSNPHITTPEVKEKLIYNILGNCSKLATKAKSDMDNWRLQIVSLVKQNKNTVFINGYTDEKTVSLTFDDGPDGSITPKVLDVLKASNVKASFFFIGKTVKTYPSVVKRAYDEGNLVLSHSFTHPELSKVSEESVRNELSLTENAIYSVIGKKPSIIRPPYGDVSQKTINILDKESYKTIIWSIDTLDWCQKDKNNIAKNVVDNVRPGDIILMHCNEDKKATLEALPMIIQGLKEKGYNFLTLSEMLHVEAYK